MASVASSKRSTQRLNGQHFHTRSWGWGACVKRSFFQHTLERAEKVKGIMLELLASCYAVCTLAVYAYMYVVLLGGIWNGNRAHARIFAGRHRARALGSFVKFASARVSSFLPLLLLLSVECVVLWRFDRFDGVCLWRVLKVG